MRARSPSSATSAASAERLRQALVGLAPTGRRHRRPRQAQVRLGPPAASGRHRRRAGPGATRPPRPPGRASRPAPAPRPGTPRRRRARDQSSAPAPAPGRASPPPSSSAPPSSARRPASSSSAAARPTVAGAFGDLGGQLAPCRRAGPGGRSRWRRARCADSAARSGGSSSASTASRESAWRKRNAAVVGVDGDDLRVDRRVRARARPRRSSSPVIAGSRSQSKRRPRTAAASSTRSGFVAERGEPAPNAVGERERHDVVRPRLDSVHDAPRVDERARRDRDREQLLDEERHAVGPVGEGHELGGIVLAPETRSDHLGHFAVVEARQLDQLRALAGRAASGPDREPRRPLLVAERWPRTARARKPGCRRGTRRSSASPSRPSADPPAPRRSRGQRRRREGSAGPLRSSYDRDLHLRAGTPPVGDQPAEDGPERCELGRVGRAVARTAELSASANGR